MAMLDGTTQPKPSPSGCTSLGAFLLRKAEIDAMLSRLQALSADHFGLSPAEVGWGEVGTLTHRAGQLRRLCDEAFHEGEHAP